MANSLKGPVHISARFVRITEVPQPTCFQVRTDIFLCTEKLSNGKGESWESSAPQTNFLDLKTLKREWKTKSGSDKMNYRQFN